MEQLHKERGRTMKVHRLNVKTEAQLQQVQDQMYQEARSGKRNFYGLLELAINPVTIITAIHRVKANKGRNTPGSDGKRMRDIQNMDDFVQPNMVHPHIK